MEDAKPQKPARNPTPTPPLGARHRDVAPQPRGGGYPDICTGAKFSPPADAPPITADDPRLAELERIGLARVWLDVAGALGWASWMRIWPLLASHQSVQNDRNRVYLPDFACYLRHQRNQLINELAKQGMSAPEISASLRACLGETLSDAHMQRLVRRAQR